MRKCEKVRENARKCWKVLEKCAKVRERVRKYEKASGGHGTCGKV